MEIKCGNYKMIINIAEGKVFIYDKGKLYSREVFDTNKKIIKHIQKIVGSWYRMELDKLLKI